jgi:iron complex transport system substrate-binding protein
LSWRITRRAALSAGVGAGAAVALGGAGTPPPQRIVSLTPCLDAILVRVADRRQIAALSHYSREPGGSSIVEIARTLPVTYGSAEEVMALRPDLLLAGNLTPPATRAALARMGIHGEEFPAPDTVADSLAQVARVARLAGHPERGETLVAAIRAAIAAAAPPPGTPRLTALVFQANGFASAEGTLVDEMLRRTGFTNMAPRYGLTRTANVPLEALIADPPDVLLAGQLHPGAPSWADRVLAHPALARLSGRMRRAVFPQRLMNCGGPVLIEAARTLAAARDDALRGRG